MRLNSQVGLALTGCLLIVYLTVFGVGYAAQISARDESDNRVGSSLVGMPKLASFDQFKTTFGKHYSSLVEELSRKRIFVARAFRVFASLISYRLRRSSSYLAINKMSDWTQDEFKRTLLTPKPYTETEGYEMEPLQHKLVNQPATIIRNNSSADHLPSDQDSETPRDDSVRNTLNVESQLITGLTYETTSTLNPTSQPGGVADVLYVDHRLSGCVGPARGQSGCGSCWSFVAMAIYEWHYCKATGYLPTFSTQYPIDCGKGRVGILDGCNGGNLIDASAFVNLYGLHFEDDYPYKALETACPYQGPEDTFRSNIPPVRMSSTGFLKFTSAELDAHLIESPLAISMWVDVDSFRDYGGGVDAPMHCKDSSRYIGGHEVLFVGSGRQDGHDYWLIRNSYDKDWGLNGYYKMSKSAVHCLDLQSYHWKLASVKLQ